MREQRLSIFDLDHTLIKTNLSFAFGKYLFFHHIMPTRAFLKSLYAYVCHKALGMPLEWLHRRVFEAYLKSAPKSFIDAHVDAFLDQELMQLYNMRVLNCLEAAKVEGQQIALLSSSPDFIVQKVAHRLNIPWWLGSCYLVDQKGILSELSTIVDGHHKSKYLTNLMQRFQLQKEAITVYSDSILDLPLFEMAGIKIAVNPDRKLKAISCREGWQVIEN